MRKIIFYFLLLVAAGEIVYLYLVSGPKEEKVLADKAIVEVTESPTATPTPTPVPTQSDTPAPKPTPVKTPTPVATPTPVPQSVFSSEQINQFIDRFSAQYTVSPDILRHIALCESGFNPLAKNAGYAGLYQFGPITWRNVRVKMGEDPDANLRLNAEEAVQTAAYNLHINNAGIWPNCVP